MPFRMERIRLTTPVEVNDLVGSRWNTDGPVVVYDGPGLESEARLPVLDVACPWCGDPISIEVGEVLDAGPMPYDEYVVEAFGLDIGDFAGAPHPIAGLGLTAYGLRDRCRRCREDYLAVVGYGEKQPARYMAVYHGVAGVGVTKSRDPEVPRPGRVTAAIARVLVVASFLALPVLVGWFHWSAWSNMSQSRALIADGVEVTGEIVSLRDSHVPRSVDSYWVTVRYTAADANGRSVEIEREIEVDAASYQVSDAGEPVLLVYDPADPYRVDMVGNDVSSHVVVLLVLTDLLLVIAGAAVFRHARRRSRMVGSATT